MPPRWPSPSATEIADGPRPRCGQHDALTRVELLWIEGRIERWIRFGRHAEEVVLDSRQRVLGFAPDAIFAYVRWAADHAGTVVSGIDILRAVPPGESCSTVPFVRPGGEILLRLSGWPKVSRALAAIDAVVSIGVDPADACPDHWRHVGHRLAAGETPRRYTAERHRAWLLRKPVEP